MDLYVVLLRDDRGEDDHDSSFVRESFPKARQLGAGGWIVAAELGTCDEVLKELQVDKDLSRHHWSGLVLRLGDDFAGFADKALWETLGQWRQS